jgi:hypothetical protein
MGASCSEAKLLVFAIMASKDSVESRNGVLVLGPILIVYLDRLAWCGHDNVIQMNTNLIEKLGRLFENLLQRSREPLRSLQRCLNPDWHR